MSNGKYDFHQEFVSTLKSPYGKDYLVKVKLPSNFGELIHQEVLKTQKPEFFVFVINQYLMCPGFISFEEYDDLLGKAREIF